LDLSPFLTKQLCALVLTQELCEIFWPIMPLLP
jgi:hypothetical protein